MSERRPVPEPAEYERIVRDESYTGAFPAGTEWVGCLFENCRFDKVLFRDCVFAECGFRRCGIHLPKLENVRFNEVGFEDCKLAGFALDRETTGESCLTEIAFVRSHLLACTFARFEPLRFVCRESRVSESGFRECALRGADFRNTVFESASFDTCDLSEADFRGAGGFSIHPAENRLRGARFTPSGALELLAPFGLAIENP